MRLIRLLALAGALSLDLWSVRAIGQAPEKGPDELASSHTGSPDAVPAVAKGPPPASGMIGFTPEHAAAERAMEARLDRLIDPKELAAWLQRMSSEPNQVSSPHDRDNAEWQLAMFKSWGWAAHIETFDALYPLPVAEDLELLGAKPFKAKLNEPPVRGDRTSGLPGQLPPYVAYQGDGDVTAPLVYVNYGLPDDYKMLERLGVSVKGKIVIARYGAGFRGVKPKLAQAHGAVGCLIYSDPADDGFSVEDPYPKGGGRNADGVQRGSVVDITDYPGDPLTPGVGSVPGVRPQFTRETAPTILKIPTLPISYGDAQPLLEALGGPVMPRASERGGLGITYHAGPSTAKVHLLVKSDWRLHPIYDVVAVMKGSDWPDQWIVRGNHHDGWVFGAEDPLSGQVALMAEAKAIGALARAGERPKRTLIYTSWDGEEPALIGSTEWAETHADELQKKAVMYLNSDNIDRGFLSVGGSQAMTKMVNEVAGDVIDPETGATLLQRQRARVAADAVEGGTEREKRLAKLALSGADLPVEPIGSGSDYTSFLHHLGVATVDLRFGGEGDRAGEYHSAYDSYDHYARFGDPGERYGAVLAKTSARVVLRVANADIAPMRFSDTAAAFAEIDGELKRLVTAQRDRQAQVEALRRMDGFRLASDPMAPLAAPPPEAPVATLDFAPLDASIAQLQTAAARYDAAEARSVSVLSPARRAALNTMLAGMEQKLLYAKGLPGRPWYRNLAYSPGVLTGYAVKTFPGVREAIEEGRYDEAQDYIRLTSQVIELYAAELDKATRIIG